MLSLFCKPYRMKITSRSRGFSCSRHCSRNKWFSTSSSGVLASGSASISCRSVSPSSFSISFRLRRFYPTQKLLDLRSRHAVSGSFFCGNTLCQRFIVHAAVWFPIYGQLVHSVVQVHRDPDNGSAGNDFPLDCLPHVRPRIGGKLVSGFRTEQPCRTEHAQRSRCPEVFQFQCKIRIPPAFPPCNRMDHTFILLQ